MLFAAMPGELLSLPVQTPNLQAVPARFDVPPRGTRERAEAVLFAHGSNFGKDSAWTRALVEGLCCRGSAVLSFDYAFRARRDAGAAPARGSVDSRAVLEHVHTQALAELRRRRPAARIILAGKSLGAHVATLLAAKGEHCSGLALFGYPLHARERTRLYSEHFPAIAQPVLFLEGTRDPLCDLKLLKAELRRFGGSATLIEIQDADHGFFRPQDGDAPLPGILDGLAAHAVQWMEASWR